METIYEVQKKYPIMKKHHSQKLVLLSLFLFAAVNAPLILIFNQPVTIGGLPMVWLYLFGVWFSSIVLSFIILQKYFD